MQLNLFDCEPGLMQALLEAAQWSPGEDFAQRCLLMALHRQAHGLAQHFSMDVFYKLPRWIDPQRVASLDELAQTLFAR